MRQGRKVRRRQWLKPIHVGFSPDFVWLDYDVNTGEYIFVCDKGKYLWFPEIGDEHLCCHIQEDDILADDWEEVKE